MSAPARPPRLWRHRALPPLLGLGAVYLALLPFAPGSGAAAPDLLYCVVAAFVIRAPGALPVAMVLALGLFADLILTRPPGLGALGLLGASEILRAPGGARRDWSAPREWLMAVLVFAAMVAILALLLKLTLLAPPTLAGLRGHVIATALAYPFVSLAVRWLTGPRRAPGREARP